MIKKVFFSILYLFLIISPIFANSNIYIFASVDNEIITNLDIKKESDYLKILNPNLNQLKSDQIINLAKESLIREIIKKKEISKTTNPYGDNQFVDSHLKNFYSKLNYSNEDEFKRLLKEKNNYSIEEIKQKIKIELFWNELIYKKYNKQVRINKEELIQKINNLNNKSKKKYFLSEIVFTKKKDQTIEELINMIKQSIKDIGFNNTANIYSVSESSKLGGKIGWVDENNLSTKISLQLNKINKGEYSDVIKVGNNYLLLKIDQIEIVEIKINKQKELDQLIQYETNKQLNQFSRIYFDKSKINYIINEK